MKLRRKKHAMTRYWEEYNRTANRHRGAHDWATFQVNYNTLCEELRKRYGDG